jgi:sigma54-dependent transcription regulator
MRLPGYITGFVRRFWQVSCAMVTAAFSMLTVAGEVRFAFTGATLDVADRSSTARIIVEHLNSRDAS